jgi:hypothetical protein
VLIACLPAWRWSLFLAALFPIDYLSYWAMYALQGAFELYFQPGAKHNTYIMVAVSRPFRCAPLCLPLLWKANIQSNVRMILPFSKATIFHLALAAASCCDWL